MLNLPFWVESPLATAIVLGAVAMLFALLQWSLHHNHRITRTVLLRLFHRRFRTVAPQSAEAAIGLLLSGLTILFSVMSLFGFSVASGIVANGDKRPLPVSKERQILQDYLQDSGRQIDIQELIRQKENKPEDNQSPRSQSL